MSLIDAGGVFRAVQRVANTVGLTLTESEGCEQPMTDMKTGEVIVPALSAYTDPTKLMLWRGYVYHEIGHHAPEVKDMLTYLEANNIVCSSLFGRLGNIVEDIRNERNCHGYYPGRDDALARTQAYHAREGVSLLSSKSSYADMDKDKQLFINVLALAYRYRSLRFQPCVSLPSNEFDKQCDSDWLNFLYDDLDNMQTAEDVFNIVRKILEQSEDHDAEEEEAKASQPSEQGEGEDGDGEGKGKAEGLDASDAEGESAEGEVSYEDLLAHNHSTGDFSTKSEGGKLSIKYDHRARNDYKPCTVNRITYPDSKATPNPRMMEMYNAGSKIGGDVKRLFQAQSQTLNTYRHRSGRLAKRDLYRVMHGDDDVFRRKDNRIDPRGTAVFLLTDASGSMTGDPYDCTAAASALMMEALAPINTPLMVASFTELHGELYSTVMKRWTDRITANDLMARYTNERKRLWMNADGDSVMWAYSELIRRNEPRKILIVLSDGEPCAHREGDAYTHLKNVVPYVSKDVECYGIGIMSDAVSHFYPEFTVLKSTSQLQQCLLDVIKLKIIGV